MCFARPLTSALMPCVASSSRRMRLDLRDVALARRALRLDELGDLLVALRLQVAEREVLELPLDLPDAEAVGQRRVDLHRLLRGADALLGRLGVERAHVVEAVGELDDDDARCPRPWRGTSCAGSRPGSAGRRGARRARARRCVSSLVAPSTSLATSGAEALRELLVRDAAVLLHVVQQRGGDRRRRPAGGRRRSSRRRAGGRCRGRR